MATAGIEDETSGVTTEELEPPMLGVLLRIGTGGVVDACIGGVMEELDNSAERELLESGTDSEENANDESGEDGDTSIVEELGKPTFVVKDALLGRMKEMVDDCNGSVAMLEAIETAVRVLEVGVSPEDIDNAEVDGTRGIQDIGAENDVAFGNVVTEVVTIDTSRTLERVIVNPRVLEEGIIPCVEADSIETSEELDGGATIADVVIDD